MLIGKRKKLAGCQKLNAVNDCDSFDVSMMLILVEAAQCELAHVEKTYMDAIASLKVQQSNSKYYKKKKMSKNHDGLEFDDEPPVFPTWSSIRDEPRN